MRFPSYAHNYGWLRWAGGQNTPANEHDLAKFMCAVGQHYLNVKSQREQQKQTRTKFVYFSQLETTVYIYVGFSYQQYQLPVSTRNIASSSRSIWNGVTAVGSLNTLIADRRAIIPLYK